MCPNVQSYSGYSLYNFLWKSQYLVRWFRPGVDYREVIAPMGNSMKWPVLLSFRGCKNFLKRWKRRAYIKVVFRIFLTWTFPGGHLAVRQWNFFQVSRGAKPSANLKKISLSNRQMSKGKSECQKNPENHLYVGKSFSKASRNFLHPSKERRYSFPFRQSLQNMAAYKVLLVTKISG